MLEGRVAIVTGGLQGIGLAIAKELISQETSVAIGSRRGGDTELSTQARQVVGDQGIVEGLDVASTEPVEHFAELVRTSLGPPDILINAGALWWNQKKKTTKYWALNTGFSRSFLRPSCYAYY